jgi:hypothetical protein
MIPTPTSGAFGAVQDSRLGCGDVEHLTLNVEAAKPLKRRAAPRDLIRRLETSDEKL